MKKKDVFVSAIKGFITGIASLVAGISVSSMLLSVSSYEDVIDGLNGNKKSLKYVTIPIALGIVLGFIAGIPLISLCLSKCKVQTIFFFVGLLLGGIKIVFSKKKLSLNRSNIFIVTLILIVVLILLYALKDSNLIITNSLTKTILLGLIMGLSIFIPGISAYSFRLKNGYKSILLNCKNIVSFDSLLLLLIFILVIVLLIIVLSKLIKHCFLKNKNNTYLILCSLVLVNVVILIVQIEKIKIDFVSIFTCLIAFLWGFIFARNVERE